jgi:hypothetical protein
MLVNDQLKSRGPNRVTNGCADTMSGTSEVPQLADRLCATRKSAEVGHKRKSIAESRPHSLNPIAAAKIGVLRRDSISPP